MASMKTCVVCGAEAHCFLYEGNDFVPYCIELYRDKKLEIEYES